MSQQIEVLKTELLDKLRHNRDRHRRVFEEALGGYGKEADRRLVDLLMALRNGKYPSIHLSLPMPEDHTRDYNRVIHMVEMHTGDTLKVDETTFACYVEDDWAWKRQFLATSTAYAAGTVAAEYGE